MNKEVLDSFTDINEYNKVELKYDLFDLEFLFPKKDIKEINIDNLIISTNTLYQELQDSHHTSIEDNIFNQRKVNLDTYRKRIEEKCNILQEIIFSFSLKSLTNDYHIVKLIDSVPFYINLNLFSLVKIIIQLAIKLVNENKISIWTNEGKIKFYMSLFLTLAIIYNKLVLNMIKNLKYFEILSILFNQCQYILLTELSVINIEDLMLVISYFKYVFFQTDKKTYYHPKIEKEDVFLFTITVNIILVSIISNRGFSNIIKLQILRRFLFNDLDPVKYYFDNYNTEYFLYEQLHKTFYFYEIEICSNRLSRDYIKEVNNTGGASSKLNIFKTINSYLKFDLAQEYEEDTSIDICDLISRTIQKLFHHFIECSITNYKEILLHLKQVEMVSNRKLLYLNNIIYKGEKNRYGRIKKTTRLF